MPVKPRLADVHCSRLKFEPGDRVLVRSRHMLDKEQIKKIKRTVQRWAGCEVEVLVVCLPAFDVEIEKAPKIRGLQDG